MPLPDAPLHRIDPATYLIDLSFQGEPETIGSYLLLGDEPALVETGPTSTLEALLRGVRTAGIDPEALRYLLVTHIHLDHAGAVGTLMRRFPKLRLFVHPAGAPHMVDPTRLLNSAGRVYGDEMDRLWGEVLPAPADRVRTLSDGERARVGGRTLAALDTPGHARHHFCFVDEERRAVFTGDVAGVSMPGIDYVRPPTPPPDIDLEAWHRSLDRLVEVQPRRLLLTHFGSKENPAGFLQQLRTRLDFSADVVRAALGEGLGGEALLDRFSAAMRPDMEAGVPEEARRRYELADNDRMNVQGLARYWKKRAASRPGDRDGAERQEGLQ